MTTYPKKNDKDEMRPSGLHSSANQNFINDRKDHSSLYKIGLTYLSVSIIFEFVDQLAFLRLLGSNEIAQILMAIRLIIDLLFILSAMYFGINARMFADGVSAAFAFLISLGFVAGAINQNEPIELIKDLTLFTFFIMKFVIFKQIFLYDLDLTNFYKKLIKYCKFTLYVGMLSLSVMFSLRQLGFIFYEQGISNLDWFVSYAVAVNRPLPALFALIIAVLLAKRMVVLSCVAVFIFWFMARLLRGNPIIFVISCLAVILAIVFLPFISLDTGALTYAIRIDLYQVLSEFSSFSTDALAQILMTIDGPRYIESLSALDELQSGGFWFGGGFGFEYLDTYTNEFVTNAHFSPVGAITKFGIFGMLLFYSLFVYAAAVGGRQHHPLAKLCGFYILATIFGSLLAWKFFLSAPLLPMAMAAAIYCRGNLVRTSFQTH